MEDIKGFVRKIENFYNLDPGRQIKYFVYYWQIERQYEMVKVKDIQTCYETLHINAYSNISAYLNRFSSKGSNQQFIKKKDGFVLLSSLREAIDSDINKPAELSQSNSLYPIAIFENTRGYLIQFANEASNCYDFALYNSCLFMIRKICEILIIELYESKGLNEKIKAVNGDYLQLSDLIKAVTNEKSWKLSKIVKENLPKIKLLADSSVHSKRFSAKKPDIDNLKTDVRITFEELITLIDYRHVNNMKNAKVE